MTAFFDMKCYKWLLKHWKWHTIWNRTFVRAALATKLRKRRSYLAKLKKVRTVFCACVWVIC